MGELSQYAKFMLALTVWRETSNTPRAWRMVIWVILNRARIGGWWGHDIVSVVTKKWQFTSMSGTGDANLTRWPVDGEAVFAAIAREVDALTDGTVPVQTDATYYFSLPLTSPPPAWGPVELVEGGDLGTVKFYRPARPPLSQTTPTHEHTTPDPSHIE